jgi:hypothetical protein
MLTASSLKFSKIFPAVRLGGPVFWLQVRGWYRKSEECQVTFFVTFLSKEFEKFTLKTKPEKVRDIRMFFWRGASRQVWGGLLIGMTDTILRIPPPLRSDRGIRFYPHAVATCVRHRYQRPAHPGREFAPARWSCARRYAGSAAPRYAD